MLAYRYVVDFNFDALVGARGDEDLLTLDDGDARAEGGATADTGAHALEERLEQHGIQLDFLFDVTKYCSNSIFTMFA